MLLTLRLLILTLVVSTVASSVSSSTAFSQTSFGRTAGAGEAAGEVEENARGIGATLSAVSHFRAWRKDRSQQDLIPVSGALKIVGRDKTRTTFEYNGKTYRAENLALEKTTEVAAAPDAVSKLLKNLAGVQAQTAGTGSRLKCETYESQKMAASKETCPLGGLEDRTSETKLPWNDWTAHLVISKCKPDTHFKMVARDSDGAYSKDCRAAKDQDLSAAASWKACAPPPPCSPKQVKDKQKLAMQRLAQDRRLHCVKSRKDYVKISDGAACLVPFEAPPQRLVIHETGLDAKLGPHRIQRSKMEEGYTDIPYHFMIGPTPGGGWKVFEGRSLKYEGAHAGAGLNSDSIAIVIAGDYDSHGASAYHPAASASQPPPEAVKLLSSLVNDLKTKYPSLKTVAGHGEMKYAGAGCVTTCPSAECQKLVNRLRETYFDGQLPKAVPLRYPRTEVAK